MMKISASPLRLLAFSFVLLSGYTSFSATITASGGNWNNNGSWVGGIQPACGDNVIIPAGVTITINTTINLDAASGCFTAVTVSVYGSLQFNNTPAWLKLACGSKVKIYTGGTVTNAGSGGNVGQIYICNILVYQTTTCVAPCTSGAIPGTNPPTTIGQTGLPIELINFDTERSGDHINLNWATATEINFDYFDLQKSTDGYNFTSLAQIKGHGTTREKHEYEFVDHLPIIGKNYYRLTSVDFDDYQETFKLIVQDFYAAKEFQVSPNPSDGVSLSFNFNFDIDPDSQVGIYDNLGSVVGFFQVTGSGTVSFGSPLKSGCYFVKYSSPSFNKVVKVLVR